MASAQLQALIDVLAVFQSLHMEVGAAKSKVMMLSSLACSVTLFNCNGQPFEPVQTFKYLGLHLHVIQIH